MTEANTKPTDESGRNINPVLGAGWIATSEQLPPREENKRCSQVPCLCYKKYEWQRKETSGVYFQIQILQFNHEHECWDDEDGDDYNCSIETVTHWMPLPSPPACT